MLYIYTYLELHEALLCYKQRHLYSYRKLRISDNKVGLFHSHIMILKMKKILLFVNDQVPCGGRFWSPFQTAAVSGGGGRGGVSRSDPDGPSGCGLSPLWADGR